MKLTSDCFTILFSERLTPDYWNIIMAEIDCSTVRSIIESPGSDSKWRQQNGGKSMIARTGQIVWKYLHGYIYSCIGWSSLLNHLTDEVSFTLHCCWRRFVLSKTLLQLPIPDRSKCTEGVVGNKKWCNYDVLFQTVWTYAIPRLAVYGSCTAGTVSSPSSSQGLCRAHHLVSCLHIATR